LDVMNGQVVRAVAGRRLDYQPLVSRLTNSCQPISVALALRQSYGLSKLYLADLDAIDGTMPRFSTYQALRDEGFYLCVDAGVREPSRVEALFTAGIDEVILGLETLSGPQTLQQLLSQFGGGRLIFSLDLLDGQPLGNRVAWGQGDPWSISVDCLALGVHRLLVLDLARVGVGGGLGTEELCCRIRTSFPHVELAAGGGVRDVNDLRRLRSLGLHAVLVGSALYDGTLRSDDLAALH
jgi:phosphoribosylformimino-5-aminoimidazole carboxamide ribotide isomerase